ncbi:hypothetical protein TNCV_2671971 [Trichonephila clavipes]|nr:hypothetical protein TNCV_2671971 [Trichonephila clavipes]
MLIRCILVVKGAESVRMFCGIMNLPPATHKILKVQPHFTGNKRNLEHSMAEAVREAVDENDGKRDLAVAVDGS